MPYMTKAVQALVLAGGYGKRLRPFTETLPKGLLEIRGDFTILDKQLLDLKTAGIQDVFLLIGFLGEKIKARYQDNWKGLNIRYCEEDKPMGTLGALKNGLTMADSDVVASNGDIVCELNLGRFIKHSQGSDKLLTIFVTKLRSPYGILEIKDNTVLSFIEKPVLDHFINGGFYYIKKESFPYFFQPYSQSENAVERTVFVAMSKKGLVGSYYEDGFWESVDGFKDLERVRKKFDRDCPVGTVPNIC